MEPICWLRGCKSSVFFSSSSVLRLQTKQAKRASRGGSVCAATLKSNPTGGSRVAMAATAHASLPSRRRRRTDHCWPLFADAPQCSRARWPVIDFVIVSRPILHAQTSRSPLHSPPQCLAPQTSWRPAESGAQNELKQIGSAESDKSLEARRRRVKEREKWRPIEQLSSRSSFSFSLRISFYLSSLRAPLQARQMSPRAGSKMDQPSRGGEQVCLPREANKFQEFGIQ